MKLKFEGKYKSLTEFITPELPDFVVLTGLNGSGKSQFLELLNQLQSIREHSGELNGETYKIGFEGDAIIGHVKSVSLSQLMPKNIEGVNKQVIDGIKNNIWAQFQKKNRTPEYQYKTICQKITDINEIEYEQLQLEDI